jgi:hypothetical protein
VSLLKIGCAAFKNFISTKMSSIGKDFSLTQILSMMETQLNSLLESHEFWENTSIRIFSFYFFYNRLERKYHKFNLNNTILDC